MRFCFLQTGMTGYNAACLRALRAHGNEVLSVFPADGKKYDFDAEAFGDFGQPFVWHDAPDQAELDRTIDSFAPDVIIMVSWGQEQYRAVMKRMRGRTLRILVSTNVWESRAKQWLGRATHRRYIDPLYDCVFVPGDRSEWFAHRLGFTPEQVIRGSNSADNEIFDRGPRDPDELVAARRFLFAGRLMPYKGVTVLRDAYRRYRAAEADPWDLEVVGLGEMSDELSRIDGVHMHGFVEPTVLSDLMHNTTCLVLPSQIDFFGVVVHEAALSGQVLLCSDGVGATPYLLTDGYNGWTVANGSVRSLASAFARVTHLDPERLVAMSERSRSLGARFSPQLWAANLTEEVARRREAGEHLH